MTNLREAPYSFKDGDVVAVVDRMEDEAGQADLTRADDQVSWPALYPPVRVFCRFSWIFSLTLVLVWGAVEFVGV